MSVNVKCQQQQNSPKIADSHHISYLWRLYISAALRSIKTIHSFHVKSNVVVCQTNNPFIIQFIARLKKFIKGVEMSLVSKSDIEVLTKQVLDQKRNILETIQRNHIEIDPSLLRQHFSAEFESKMEKLNEQNISMVEDGSPISLDEFNEIFQILDAIDKELTDPKERLMGAPSSTAHPKVETNPMKRFGSMTDLNRTMMRTSSMLNLSTKGFLEPTAPAPRSHHNQQTSSLLKIVERDMVTSNDPITPLSVEQIAEFNLLIKGLEDRLANTDLNHSTSDEILSDFQAKYSVSFERLNDLFKEINKLQTAEANVEESKDPLNNLDTALLQLMTMLSEVCTIGYFDFDNRNLKKLVCLKLQTLERVRFLNENRNMFSRLNGDELAGFSVSNDLTMILDDYFK